MYNRLGLTQALVALCLCQFAIFLVSLDVEAATIKPKTKPKPIIIKGNLDADRIINGVNATIEEFPEIVQLSDKNNRFHECGGFLVTPRHVVTAAHCVKGEGNGNFIKVVANATFAKYGGIERHIEAFYVPKEYNKKSRNFDVAVLKLVEPFPLGVGIKVAKLCEKSWKRQQRLRLAGWGYTENGGNLAERLMTTTVTTISDKKCKERLANIKVKTGKNKFKTYNFTDTMACALSKTGTDACKGDSGGPAYINGEVCGIVSWGFECGRGKLPSFYTSIAKARKFIDESLLK